MVAEEIVKAIQALPKEDRVPVMRSILKSAGSDVEGKVLEKERWLINQGVDGQDALSEALSWALSEPWGLSIISVVASAGAQEAAKMGILPAGTDTKQAAEEYARVLMKAEDVQGDEGLGFIGTIIAAVTAVAGIAANGISAAVHKARSRRRQLKARLTPVTDAEIEQIVTIVVPKYPVYSMAEEEILENIAQIRRGRRAYLLDPPSGDNAGSKVNERKRIKAAFDPMRAQFDAQILAARKKKMLMMGAIAAGGAFLLVGGATVIFRRR